MPRTKTTFNSKTARKAGQNKKGKTHKSTIVKKKLGIDGIESMRADVEKVWKELLKDKDKKNRAFAAKEISKYLFPTKTENKNENKFVNPPIIFMPEPKRIDDE